jgi:hypothetical protein
LLVDLGAFSLPSPRFKRNLNVEFKPAESNLSPQTTARRIRIMRFSFNCLAAPFALAVALALAGCGDDAANPIDNTPIDTTPPATPVGLTITHSETTLLVQWDDNSEADLAGYVLEKSVDRGNRWGTVGGLLSSSEFEDVFASRADYRVRAQDLTGNESANSSEITFIAPTGPPPKNPTNPE